MPDLRRFIRSGGETDLVQKDESAGKKLFKAFFIALFFVFLGVSFFLSVFASMGAITVAASLAFGIALYALIDIDEFRKSAYRLRSGKTGDEAYDKLKSHKNDRDGWFK